MPNRDYHNERREYEFTELSRDHLASEPYSQFNTWMDQAFQQKIPDPTAMSLSTVGEDGQPHSRIVLLKENDEKGFVFYTHYDSHKGQQIEANPKAALLFFWPDLDRQIRIEGRLNKIPYAQSDAYFQTRPRDSQIAASSSVQSTVVPGRKTLEQNFSLQETLHENQEINCPRHWGGYRLKPVRFEFWQGRANRLHDRFVFQLENGQWEIERLAP